MSGQRDSGVRDLGRLAGGASAYALGDVRRGGRAGAGLPGDVPGVRAGVRSDAAAERAGRGGQPETFGEEDLYPDARTALAKLRDDGLWVGIAGNQTVRAGGILRSLDLPSDMIATSDDWGVSKPDPGFFRAVVEASPWAAEEILYVGDRLDNDIKPAAEMGLRTALIRRGPWGIVQQDDPEADRVPTMRIDSLADLPGRVAEFNAGGR
ncbi:HAD family hydrolase [Actinomadura sp. WMMB 499]|uniref:HAD family hydrolase n=1 Tax=Actinomadura sp. WMMB 499 TaxID=1219491 RepID=UPI0020C7A1D8